MEISRCAEWITSPIQISVSVCAMELLRGVMGPAIRLSSKLDQIGNLTIIIVNRTISPLIKIIG